MGIRLIGLGLWLCGFRQVILGGSLPPLQNGLMPSTLLYCQQALAPIKPLANVTDDLSIPASFDFLQCCTFGG